ncbi:YihY/virulence factor BrkB family protein [Micromonospora krabiensis]|uniref:Membrane protein n=1 Tax=Micromonospora krabiensis TaxID=307121 RepID=A0A1C3NCF1_9ACTN|nr:YihY/virulence factor BrkB family protein [Micromonospora krabiensis]SBV30229.1 membrane protein [Micromonospora krabiensis]
MTADESSARSGRDRDDSAEPGAAATGGASGRRDPSPVGPDEGPQSPTKLPGTGWKAALRRTVREFQDDNLTDWAAALTYYGVLSIFPGLLVLISILGLLGSGATESVRDTVSQAIPEGNIQRILEQAIDQAKQSGGLASLAAVLGLLAAFWSASGYIAAFMRASNAIYDVPEGRPIWKTLPIRVGVTAVVGVLLLVSAVIVVFTGRLAEAAGDAIGLGSTAVTVWNIAKWPVLLVLVSLMFAILYWASPNARHGGFRWVSPGGVLAVVIWLVVSGLFAFYVTNFGSYNKTYGTLAGVIIFLVWLWLTNIAILLGAEFDAELERSRAIAAGHDADEEPYVELRDDRKLRKKQKRGRAG